MLLSPDPKNTRPSAIAAEDLTGPVVLNDHKSFKLSGNDDGATPVSAGLPRNMGHDSAGLALAPAKSRRQTMERVAFIPCCLRSQKYGASDGIWQTNTTYTYQFSKLRQAPGSVSE